MKAEETRKIKKSAGNTALKESVSGKAPKKTASKISGAARKVVSPENAAAKRPAVHEKDTAGQEAAQTGKPKNPPKTALKIFLPGADAPEKETHEFDFSGLPDEYGETSIIAMAVDPNTVFVDWEIIPRDIAGEEGDLTLRLYDITGSDSAGGDRNASIDVRIDRRVGRDFFTIKMPGRDVIAEEGVMTPEGTFLPIVRSDIISFPVSLASDDHGIVQQLLKSGIPLGY